MAKMPRRVLLSGHFVFAFGFVPCVRNRAAVQQAAGRVRACRVTPIQVSSLPPNSLFFIGFLSD
jgi:hypothetical protein